MLNVNHPFKNITPSDIINLVNVELARLNASHNLGAALFNTLNFGKNDVVCTSKKFKSSVKLYVNKSYGDFRGFVIHSQTKDGNLATLSGMDCWRALNDGIAQRREKTAEEISQEKLSVEQAEKVKIAAEMGRKQDAVGIYKQASATGENAYLARKNVVAHKNVRFAGRNLIVPLYQFNTENTLEIHGIQSISLTGKITKGLKKNSFFPIGNIETPKSIYFCEGYATGSSIYESLTCKDDSLVVVSVDAGNMKHIVDTFAEIFADIYNSYGFTVCCDNDMWKPKPADRFTGFKIAHEIAESHPKILISYPFFDPAIELQCGGLYSKLCGTPYPTDFNDFARCEFGNHDAEKVKFSSSEFFSQIYDFKNNSLCDVEKQSRLREFKLRTPIKRAVIKICAPILPILQVDRAEREAAKIAADEKIRSAKVEINARVEIACEQSDAATSAELSHLSKSKLKSIQSARRAEIRASGNLAKKAIENAKRPVEKYRIADVEIDSDANAIAAYFAPFKDVEIGMATGKFSQITSKYVDIPLLEVGATELLYCGMGSGKTTNFIKQSIELIEQIYLTENRSAKILVLSPRKALVNKLVFDLNRAVVAWKTENRVENTDIQQFYSYETLKKGGVDGQKIQANLLVSTVHSAKFFDTDNFDLVIADEFHQSRNCFIQQMENKVENYESLNATIRTARRFIATGADLTQFDIDFIEILRGQSHVHYQLPANQQKNLTFYQNKKQAVKSAWEFIKAGQSLIVASNSKAFIKAVAKLLDKLGISNLVIYDEVTGEPTVSRFLDDPNIELDKYQVVLYSPVITSGISFDALPTRTDRKVFGYFTSHIGTASDAWQMLGRFRGNGTEYHVCLDAPIKDAGILAQERTDTQLRRFIERVARNAAKLGDLVDIPQVKRLLNQQVGQSVEYTAFDIDNFSLQDQEIAAQRNYFAEFVTQMLAQKITFSLAEHGERDVELQKMLSDAVDAVKIEDIQRVVQCNSKPINEKRREEIKNKSRVTQAESAEAKHFDYRAFLATPELSERDVEFMTKRGKSKIYAIERANAELLPIHLKQAHDELASSPISLVRFGLNHGEFIKRLLAVVGLAQFKDGQIQLSEKWGEWGGKINISTPSVQRFFAWAWENRNWINNLQIADLRTITEGFSDNLTWLNSALAAIGIKLQCYEKIAVGTARVRKYCVDLDNLDYINSILARRFNKIHAEKLESPTMEMG